MEPAEREAWERFEAWVREARPAFDGMVPIALICLPVERITEDGAVEIARRGHSRILWPKTFPIEERGPLLRALAAPYSEGTVSR
jgi:hypothetical protein